MILIEAQQLCSVHRPNFKWNQIIYLSVVNVIKLRQYIKIKKIKKYNWNYCSRGA